MTATNVKCRDQQ